MLKEITLQKKYLSTAQIDSIYFGGGSPSVLSERELGLLMEALAKQFSWSNGAEITLEANPDDMNASLIKAWRALGVNRLSIGLQSFNEEELKWMNRAHTAAQSADSVKLAQDLGFDNISIDLIYGSKFQDQNTWATTLQKAMALNTQHISAYNLTIEHKTVLGLKLARGQEPAVDEYVSGQQFLQLRDTLQSNDFIQYEVSNFGKANYFARHNSSYWKQETYLGIGPSAHSYNGVSRQWNVRNNAQYINAVQSGSPYFEVEQLSTNNRYNEYVMTGLRTIWGCDVNAIETQFGIRYRRHFETMAATKTQLMEQKNDRYSLNPDGLLQADGLASAFFLLD